MVRDSWRRTGPGIQAVLDTLDDPVSRSLFQHLAEPKTVQELAAEAGVPRSTTYRKINQLEEASLVEPLVEMRMDGHHTTRYRLAFEEVTFRLDDDRELILSIVRPPQTPDERLSALWQEVRKGT
ncbi:ArsR/SmtB family transcription factor [Haladaptatus sp. GCM10025707]|uniref:ArsR/SmtB family transcription factor n=1 Tax=unclassified Haladaptatus TaxID=2622732 RepID=UPI0023E78B4F|nr:MULTISPECIES: helix-turn-helix domain-containing protein [unclassified Haladaptatus]